MANEQEIYPSRDVFVSTFSNRKGERKVTIQVSVEVMERLTRGRAEDVQKFVRTIKAAS